MTVCVIVLIISTIGSLFLCWWLNGIEPIDPIGRIGPIGFTLSVVGWIMFVLNLAGKYGWALD